MCDLIRMPQGPKVALSHLPRAGPPLLQSSAAHWKAPAHRRQTRDRQRLPVLPHRLVSRSSPFTQGHSVSRVFLPAVSSICSPPPGREPPRKSWVRACSGSEEPSQQPARSLAPTGTCPLLLAVSIGYTHSEKERKANTSSPAVQEVTTGTNDSLGLFSAIPQNSTCLAK